MIVFITNVGKLRVRVRQNSQTHSVNLNTYTGNTWDETLKVTRCSMSENFPAE